MSVLWSDALAQTNDYIRNYASTTIDQGNKDRALNRSIEYFQRRLSLPSDRRFYNFYYVQDTMYYTMPAGFNESIGLFYNTQSLNIPKNKWTFRPDIDIMAAAGMGGISALSSTFLTDRFWGFSTANQALQLVMLGPNTNQPQLIDSISATTNWAITGDGSALAVDNNIFQVGPASLSFTITPSAGTTTLTLTGNTFDLTNFVNNNGFFQFYVDFTSTNFTNVKLVLQSSAGNKWTGTITTKSDGTAFSTGTPWNKLGVYFNNMVATGSPVKTAINNIQIVFTNGVGLTTQANMRVNYLYATIPDYMNLLYFSSYKGYQTGVTPKVDILNFNATAHQNDSDTLYFGDFAPDLIGPIAKRAAVELIPQLRQNPEWYNSYKAEIEDWLKIFGRIYPRVRTMNYGRSKLQRTFL